MLDPEVTLDSSASKDPEVDKGSSVDSDMSDGPIEGVHLVRFRDEMLGDSDWGLSPEEVAKLTERPLNTVRTYLSDPKQRKRIGDAIRKNQAIRERALNIISKKRNKHVSE